MPTISGRAVFDRNRSNTIDAGDSGLANIEIVLQDTASNIRLVVLTDTNGNYSFINVPNGSYRIVESFGTGGGVATPGDFNSAVAGPIPLGEDPPIGFATNPPTGSTDLDSITPNTLLVSVTGSDLLNQNFLDGPVIYTSIDDILDPCATISPVNIITAADNGTFGSFQPGTLANTGEPNNPPYPGVTPDFTYVLPSTSIIRPQDGQYTVQNIMNDAFLNNRGDWWRVTARSIPDERGRFMVVNGFNPGAIFFQQTVSVLQNTNYLFSSWIINMTKLTGRLDPALGVQILDENNNVIFQQTLGNTIPVNTEVPEWKQIGTSINTGNNSQITVRFTSQGAAGSGNDYAIDEVSLQEISFPIFTPVKSVNPQFADINQTVTYTITLENTCSSSLTNVFFQDTIPPELSFVPQSVTGGTNPLNDNPNTGFVVPDILGNSITTITFEAIPITIPTSNPVDNVATMDYSYTPVQGGILEDFSQQSNISPLQINNANLVMTKSSNSNFVLVGDIITYTVEIENLGNTNAEDIIFIDPIPNGTSFVDGSLSLNGTMIPGNPNPPGVNIGSILPGVTSSVSFQVTADTIPNPNPIPNSATTSYTYTVDPTNPNGASGNSTSNIDLVQVDEASLLMLKTSNPTSVKLGDAITYTIVIVNNGTLTVNDVEFTDTPPNGTIFIPGSVEIDGVNTPNADPSSGINLGTINPGDSVVVSFMVRLIQIVNSEIINISNVVFEFERTPGGQIDTGSSQSDSVTVSVNQLIATISSSQYFYKCNILR